MKQDPRRDPVRRVRPRAGSPRTTPAGPNFTKCREQGAAHPIEETGKQAARHDELGRPPDHRDRLTSASRRDRRLRTAVRPPEAPLSGGAVTWLRELEGHAGAAQRAGAQAHARRRPLRRYGVRCPGRGRCEPPPLTPRTAVSAASRKPAAGVLHRHTTRRRPAAGSPPTRSAAPSGVCAEDVLQQGVQRRGQILAATARTRIGAAGQDPAPSAGRCPRPAPTRTRPARRRPRPGRHRAERPSRTGRRAVRITSSTSRFERVDVGREPGALARRRRSESTSSRSAVTGVRSRWARSATSSRSAASSSLDAAGQAVEPDADAGATPACRSAATRARRGRRRPAGRPCAASAVTEPTSRRPSRSASSRLEREQRQSQQRRARSTSRTTPPCSATPRHVRPDHRGARRPGPAPASSTSMPPPASRGERAAARWPARSTGVRAAGAPHRGRRRRTP